MGLYLNACIFSGIIFAFTKEPMLIVYFFAFIGIYTMLYILTPSGKFNPTRRKLMIASWKKSEEGNIFAKEEIECTKLIKFLEGIPKDKRPTVTHYAIKALVSRSFLNGKLIFDKFVPFDNVSVTCLIDIGGGEDLAALTIPDIDKMTISEIQDYLRTKADHIKKNKGGDEHKKQTGPLKLLPPFVIRLLIRIVQWLSFNFGINIKAMAVKRNAFGAGCVTSVGMLGIKDAYVPFTPFMNCPVIMAVGEMQKKPIVNEKGQLEVGNILNCNFTIDHRFIDGGKAKNLLGSFQDVFQNPQKYI